MTMNADVMNQISEALTHAGEDPQQADRLRRLEARRITPDTQIPPREFLFTMFGIPCFPRGELVALTGKEKSGKTFVTSLLMTLCVRDEALSLRRNVSARLAVLWYDTEQSEESTQEILVGRIGRMLTDPEGRLPFDGEDRWMDSFHVFNVRAESWSDRLPLLETAIGSCHPDLVILDGIRDLVDDINDGVLSQSVVERLMHLASDSACCIVCVLHQNKSGEDHNLRGWIGTELTYKSFEVYECVKDADRIFSLQQTRTRKYDIIDKMRYVVDSNGLPQPCSIATADVKNSVGESCDNFRGLNPVYMDNGNVNLIKVFHHLLPEGTRLRAYELERSFLSLLNMRSSAWYGRLRQQAIDDGLIERVQDGPQCVFYRLKCQHVETDLPADDDMPF